MCIRDRAHERGRLWSVDSGAPTEACGPRDSWGKTETQQCQRGRVLGSRQSLLTAFATRDPRFQSARGYSFTDEELHRCVTVDDWLTEVTRLHCCGGDGPRELRAHAYRAARG